MQDVQVDPSKFPSIMCEGCNGKLFEAVITLKVINKLVVGEPKDKIVPYTLFRCADCGEVLESGKKLLEL